MEQAESPAEEPNESAWNEEAVEGQLDDLDEDEGGVGQEDEDD